MLILPILEYFVYMYPVSLLNKTSCETKSTVKIYCYNSPEKQSNDPFDQEKDIHVKKVRIFGEISL